MPTILTNEQVAKALWLEADYDSAELTRYANSASSFIKQKTGHDFAADVPVEPLAIELAVQYVRQLHFGANGYDPKHDYSLGITSLISDLQDIIRAQALAAEVVV